MATNTLSNLVPAGNTAAAQSFITSGFPNSSTTPPTSIEQACSMARSINSAIISKLNTLQNKINSLNSAVNSLLNMSPIPTLPNLSDLLSVANIDLNAYRALQQACPQLNLPSVSGLPSVPDLQSIVSNAFSSAIKAIDQSPLGMLQALDNQFNAEIAALLAEIGVVTPLLNCLCQSGQFTQATGIDSAIKGNTQNLIPVDTQKAISTYNYITGQSSAGKPTLLKDDQAQQVAQGQQVRNTLRQLLTVPSS